MEPAYVPRLEPAKAALLWNASGEWLQRAIQDDPDISFRSACRTWHPGELVEALRSLGAPTDLLPDITSKSGRPHEIDRARKELGDLVKVLSAPYHMCFETVANIGADDRDAVASLHPPGALEDDVVLGFGGGGDHRSEVDRVEQLAADVRLVQKVADQVLHWSANAPPAGDDARVLATLDWVLACAEQRREVRLADDQARRLFAFLANSAEAIARGKHEIHCSSEVARRVVGATRRAQARLAKDQTPELRSRQVRRDLLEMMQHLAALVSKRIPGVRLSPAERARLCRLIAAGRPLPHGKRAERLPLMEPDRPLKSRTWQGTSPRFSGLDSRDAFRSWGLPELRFDVGVNWIVSEAAAFIADYCSGRTDLYVRRCGLPRGLVTHLDFRLGIADQDAPRCQTIYVCKRDRPRCCGRPTCSRTQTYLANEHLFMRELEGRAVTQAHKSAKGTNIERAADGLLSRANTDLTEFSYLLE